MKELTCEDALIAQMAAADGEESGFSEEQLAAHIAACANCQHELKQLQVLNQVLTDQSLAEPSVNLWPAIETRIARPARSRRRWQPFALIGLLLVIHKLLEMLPASDPGMFFKLVPLVIAALLFVLIKENPFKINTELMLER
jgi:anti-sigma factor RsiW